MAVFISLVYAVDRFRFRPIPMPFRAFRSDRLLPRVLSIVLSLTMGIAPALVPVAAVAAPPAAQLLKVSETDMVSRGDFIRAAIRALDIPTEKGRRTLPYEGVPAAYRVYVQTADTKKALGIFGKNLELKKTITRGEALVLLQKLQDVSPVSKDKVSFTDAKSATMRAAVQLAVEQNWMRPLSEREFGVAAPLKGKEGILLLQRVSRAQPAPMGNIKITIPVTRSKALPKEDVLRTIYQLLEDEYLYREKLDATKAMDKSIESFVKTLDDPYTVYMPPTQSVNFQNQLKGELEGIGANIELTGGLIMIVSPLRGSPAERAGIQPKDQVISADDVPLTGLTLDEAVSKIRGPKGTTVKLRIRREGSEFDVSVTREKITIPEVDITVQEGVAVVKIMQFGQTTDTMLKSKMLELKDKNIHGIVLDLRSNPGGLLHAAEVVSGFFLPKGSTYVTIAGRTGNEAEKTDSEPVVDASIRLVVLVNAGSASAAEIVAGALQDAGRGRIVGTKTFGKGTVQQVIQFGDGSSLKMTIAEWKTPKGNKIDGVGVMPDEVLEQEQGSRDTQLLRAMELLR